MSDALVLHDWTPDVRCYAVRLGLSLMGLPFATRAVDMDLAPGQRPRAGIRPLPARAAGGQDAAVAPVHDPAVCRPPARRGPTWLDPVQGWAVMDWLDFGATALDTLATLRTAAFGTTLPVLPGTAPLEALLRRMEDHMAARALAGRHGSQRPRPALPMWCCSWCSRFRPIWGGA
ncbi:glutathione S-transferase family protein [Komagataeibacter rhaeticus]|nr:glutathione S-transferase family protein [Komagataeibacter rhaeticus]